MTSWQKRFMKAHHGIFLGNTFVVISSSLLTWRSLIISRLQHPLNVGSHHDAQYKGAILVRAMEAFRHHCQIRAGQWEGPLVVIVAAIYPTTTTTTNSKSVSR